MSHQPTLPEQPANQQAAPQAHQPQQPLPVPPQQAAPQGPVQPAPYPAQQPRPAQATTLGQTNTYAVVSIITVFLAPVAGIVFGHMGLSQIKRTGDAGRGLALTGLIIGYAYFVLIALFVIFYISMIGLMLAGMGAAMGEFGSYGDYDYSY